MSKDNFQHLQEMISETDKEIKQKELVRTALVNEFIKELIDEYNGLENHLSFEGLIGTISAFESHDDSYGRLNRLRAFLKTNFCNGKDFFLIGVSSGFSAQQTKTTLSCVCVDFKFEETGYLFRIEIPFLKNLSEKTFEDVYFDKGKYRLSFAQNKPHNRWRTLVVSWFPQEIAEFLSSFKGE